MTEAADLIAMHFIARPDVMAIQGRKGVYAPARVDPHDKSSALLPFTREKLQEHIAGTVTLGHYLVNRDSCKLFCFDIDLDPGVWHGSHDCRSAIPDGLLLSYQSVIRDQDHPLRGQVIALLRSVADGLEWSIRRKVPGVRTAVSFSGSKGLHVYALYGELVFAKRAIIEARRALSRFTNGGWPLYPKSDKNKKYNQWASHAAPGITIEVYPKQDQVEEGHFGNLLRVPLGVHTKTGQRSFFINTNAPITELEPVEFSSVFND